MSKAVYMQVKDLHLEGNLVDNGWIENLKYDSGKPNMNAVLILSEIVYWYKPSEVREEGSGRILGYKKKFKADKLQKSYQELANRFGLTKRQAKLAIKFLVDKEIISIEFRTVKNKVLMNNVMFIELIFDKLKEITGINRDIDNLDLEDSLENDNLENDPITIDDHTLLHSSVTPSDNRMPEPMTPECHTNTKITTKITTKINNNNRGEVKKVKNNITSAKDKEKEAANENNCSTEEINAIKDKADVKLGTKINKNTLLSLVREHGKDKVEYYLDNWNKFESTKKHNTIGFFVKCVSGGWEFPKNGGGIQEKPIQETNYYQREYSDEDFEAMYDKLV